MAEEQKPTTESIQAPQPTPQQPPVQPAQTPVEQPVQPVQQMPQSAPSSNNKMVIAIVGVILAVVIGVAGYGYWNGSQVKNYALKAEKTLNAAKTWKSTLDINFFSDLSSSMSTASEISSAKDKLAAKQKDFEKVKSDIESNLADLSSASAPGKAGDLKNNIKEYLNSYKEVSDDALYTIQVGDSALDVVNSLLSLYSTDPTSLDTNLDAQAVLSKVQKAYEDWAVALKKIQPPASMKDQHDKFVKAVEDAATALKNGDTAALTNMSNPFDANDIDNIVKKQTDNIDSLSTKIEEEVNNLKNTSFSF